MQWKALTSFGGLASTICHCLNFPQVMKKDEKLISPSDIEGKIKLYS
jgi:hypothetical protein